MRKFQLLLSVGEIKEHLVSVKSLKEKISFLGFLQKELSKICSSFSDKDITAYIAKHKLNNKYPFCTAVKPVKPEIINPLQAQQPAESLINKEKYIGSHYKNLLNIISIDILPFVEKTLNSLSEIIKDENGVKMVFTREAFTKKFDSFKKDTAKMEWVSALSEKLNKIYWDYSDEQLEELFNYYNIAQSYPQTEYDNMITISSKRVGPSKYRNFLYYLENYTRGFVNSKMFNLRGDMQDEKLRKDIKAGKVSIEDKFKLWDFNLSTIKYYSDKIFPDLEDKIEYFSYVVTKYYQKYTGNEWILEWQDEHLKYEIIKIEKELAFLKTQFEMRKSKAGRKPAQSVSSRKKSVNKFENRKFVNKDKLVWLGSAEQLKLFLSLLQKHNIILNNLDSDPECEKLLFHFIDNNEKPFVRLKSAKKIILMTTAADLLYLYKNLAFVKNNLFSTKYIWIQSENIFRDNSGGILKHKNLSASYHILSDKERPVLDDIIKIVSTY